MAARHRCAVQGCGHYRYEVTECNPVESTITGLMCSQKGKMFILGDLPADELDRLCNVPSINKEVTNIQIASTIRDYCANSSSLDQWQRDLDTRSTSKIAMWWNSEYSNLVNPVIIGRKDEPTRPHDNEEETWVPIMIEENQQERGVYGNNNLFLSCCRCDSIISSYCWLIIVEDGSIINQS